MDAKKVHVGARGMSTTEQKFWSRREAGRRRRERANLFTTQSARETVEVLLPIFLAAK